MGLAGMVAQASFFPIPPVPETFELAQLHVVEGARARVPALVGVRDVSTGLPGLVGVEPLVRQHELEPSNHSR